MEAEKTKKARKPRKQPKGLCGQFANLEIFEYWSAKISCRSVSGRHTNVAVIKRNIMEYTYNSTICKNGLVYTQNIEKRVC